MKEIPASEIAQLAELYDRFAHALDPFSDDRDKAEDAFYRKLEHLRCSYAAEVKMAEFKLVAIRQCKLYLRKN